MNKKSTASPEAFISSFQKFLQDDALRIIKEEALIHFNNSFTYQGFTDKNLVKWPKRKVPKRNGKPITGKTLERWRAKDQGRAILVGHSDDTKGTHLMTTITGELAPGMVTIYVDKENNKKSESTIGYAQVHNDGLKAGRPPGFTMPKRQFIGPSEKLEQKIQAKFEKEITKLIKKF